MYDYEDYYSEPSEFEQQIDEFKESLMKVVKEEHQNEINRLRKENEDLQETKKNFNSIKKDYESKIRELENEKQKLESNAKRMRLEELFEGEFNVILYRPYDKTMYHQKCNKCDDDRKVKFSSPSGKEYKEDCNCAKGFRKYSPSPYYCSEFRVNRRRDKGELPLLMWYKKYNDYSSDYDGYTYDSSDLIKTIYSEDMDYETIKKEYSYSIYFKSEVDCQKYCDWLNEQNGITDDMVTDIRISRQPKSPKSI